MVNIKEPVILTQILANVMLDLFLKVHLVLVLLQEIHGFGFHRFETYGYKVSWLYRTNLEMLHLNKRVVIISFTNLRSTCSWTSIVVVMNIVFIHFSNLFA